MSSMNRPSRTPHRVRPHKFDPLHRGRDNKPIIPGVEALSSSELLAVLACIELRRLGRPITIRVVAAIINRSTQATANILCRLDKLGLVTFHKGSAARVPRYRFIGTDRKAQS